MPRIARIVLEGIPYHITQRGNARQQVFFDRLDYQLYLDLLRDRSESARLGLLAYCLMPNHVHLIAVPERSDSLAAAVGRTQAEFARHFNLRQRSCGHVWQSRYFSCPLDDPHLWTAMAYVERNPVRARIVEQAERFPWSSAAERLGVGPNRGLVDLRRWRSQYTREQWKEALESSVQEEAFGRRLQEASRRGRALGSGDFVRELEGRAGRRLRPLPVGRPRKNREGEMSLEIGV
jgi:putative transposase